MPIINLQTEINAHIQRCFDLSRSIDLHIITTKKTREKAIAGKTTGLIQLNDTVTWEAKHFGIRQQLTSRISQYRSPEVFVDEMVKGAFKRIYHEHWFKEMDGKTTMTDIFDYTAPMGILGKFAGKLFLSNYMRGFLLKRNQIIKEFAETDKWKDLPGMNLNS